MRTWICFAVLLAALLFIPGGVVAQDATPDPVLRSAFQYMNSIAQKIKPGVSAIAVDPRPLVVQWGPPGDRRPLSGPRELASSAGSISRLSGMLREFGMVPMKAEEAIRCPEDLRQICRMEADFWVAFSEPEIHGDTAYVLVRYRWETEMHGRKDMPGHEEIWTFQCTGRQWKVIDRNLLVVG
jgi:hypothetical protein